MKREIFATFVIEGTSCGSFSNCYITERMSSSKYDPKKEKELAVNSEQIKQAELLKKVLSMNKGIGLNKE